MKKIGLLNVILFSFLSFTSYGQNWLAGGNPTAGPNGVDGTNNILGTDGNFPLRFHTNNTEQMRLLANGSLGIGTATPGSLLEVNGDMNLTDDVDFYRIEGEEVLYADTSDNLGVGTKHDMGTITTGFRNILIGNQAGSSISTGFPLACVCKA